MEMNNNKVAIVTGASRGIGQATAIRLAQDGFAVVVHYAGNAEKAEKTVAEIESKGGQAIALQADVSKVEDVERLYQETLSKFGAIHVVVHCAGEMDLKPFHQTRKNLPRKCGSPWELPHYK